MQYLLLTLVASSCATGDGVTAPPAVKSIVLTAPKSSIEAGEPLTINASARDARDSVVAGAVITWSATPSAVASVAGGIVTAIAPGTASISAASGSASATLTIDVVPAAAARVALAASSQSIAPGQTASISATVRDARNGELSGRTVIWSSTDTRVIAVSAAGVATALAPGTAFVVARSDGVRDSVLLTVPDAAAELVITPGDVNVGPGQTRVLSARLRSAQGVLTVASGVMWSTTNASAATVLDGVVTGVAPGNATVRGQAGALTASVQVSVGAVLGVYSVDNATTNQREIRADSINISGVLSVNGPLTLYSTGDVIITGEIQAPCQPLVIIAGGRVVLSRPGTSSLQGIDNTCPSTPPDPAPGIRIEASGGYRVFTARIRSTGDIVITNDAGLVPEQFVGSPIDREREVCALVNGSIENPVSLIASSDGAIGAAGRNGARVDISCRGSLRAANFALNVRGGSNGGRGLHPSLAVGGDGGRSGSERFRVTGDLIIDVRRLYFRILGGGIGGDASATQSGSDGAGASAIGGRGGDDGSADRPTLELRVAGSVIKNDPSPANPIEVGVFLSGRGGNAIAVASAGPGATSSTIAGAGGAATAVGGAGGHVYAPVIAIRGTLPANAILVLGSPAASGGTASASSGSGGSGSLEFPNGGPGGAVRAEGGDGGTSDAINSPSGSPTSGGNGGRATFAGGVGGAGFDRCAPAGIGGIGGAGGSLFGADGRAGTGQTNGLPDGITIAGAGIGGPGGRGATPGAGGRRGTDATLARGARVVQSPSLIDGAIGGLCTTTP